jgi:predicted transposase/invertase (TIGR01784 family)
MTKKYDKGYRRMLSDKRNFLDFVKSHIAAPWVDGLDTDCLEHIDAKFVTKDFKDKESDIVYKAKIKGKEVIFYILLELQSTPDFTMPLRLLVYMTELIRRLFVETEEKARERKEFKLPAVVPVVLYNGADKWSCAKSFKEYLKDYELFVPSVIDFTYIMIDINETDEDELLSVPTLVNLAMFADRKGNPARVLGRLTKVLELSRKLTEDEQVQLRAWIFDVILQKIKNKTNKNTIMDVKKAFERKGESEMTYAIERAIDEIEQRGIRKGELNGKLKTAMAMIDDGLPIETASKCSGISADKLRQSIEKRKPR